MAFLRLLVCALLSIGVLHIAVQETVKASVPISHDTYSSEDIKPRHYTIKIAPATEFDFVGECNISIEILKPTQTVTLESEDIAVNKAKLIEIRPEVTDGNLRESKDIFIVYKTTYHEYNITTGNLILRFNNHLLNGNYILNLHFSGSINVKSEGLFRIPFTRDNGNKLWMLATNTLITGARGLFPCWNDPALKTTFNISIRHHKTQIALSNTPKRDSEISDIDMMWTHFHITPPMSTHEIAVAVIPEFFKSYTGTDQSDNSVMLYGDSTIEEYAEQAHRVALDVMSFLKMENILGELKVPQVSYVAIPGFQYETIATLGIVLHRQEDIACDETSSFVTQKIHVDRFVARQMALQWFIGSVKPSLWSYQWLNGVAEFFGIYALDKIYEASKMMNWFVVHTVHDSLHLDVDNLMESITEPIDTSSNATHFRVPPFIKVPVVLRMLENTLGRTFWNDTRAYLRKESINNSNFWTCMPVLIAPNFSYENTFKTHTCNIISTQNYPLLKVKQKDGDEKYMYNDEDAQYIHYMIYVDSTSFITTERYGKYQIPISYTIYANLHEEFWNESSEVYKFQWLDEEAALQLPVHRVHGVPGWLIVNINQTGYYRVAYLKTWDNIGVFLNSSLYRKIPVLNRAQIIDDAYHLVVKKTISSSLWFKLISYLKEEEEYEAWYPMIRIFEDISGFLPFEDQTIVYIKEKMAYLIDNLLHKIGFLKMDDEDLFKICLKYEALKWACLFGSAKCTSNAKSMLQLIELDEIENRPVEEEDNFCPFPSSFYFIRATIPKYTVNNFVKNKHQLLLWREWIYCDGLRNVEESEHTLEKILYILSYYKLKSENTFLKFIPCFGYDTVSNFFNDTTYTDILPLQDIKRVVLFHSLVAKHANNHVEQILKTLFLIKPRTMKPSTALCNIINHVYSHTQLLKIKIFVTKVLNYNIPSDHLNEFFEEFEEHVDKDATISSSKTIIFKERTSLLLKKVELRSSQINKHVDSLKELKVLIGL